MASLGELREALTALGLSTSTGALRGEERRAALEQRLFDAQPKLVIGGGYVKTDSKDESKANATVEDAPWNAEAIRSMSLSQLRSELEARTLSTQTPGLKGDTRRHALIQRLQNAGGEVRSHIMVHDTPEQPAMDADAEALKSSRSSSSSYSAASEFLFFDALGGDTRVSSVPTLQFPTLPTNEQVHNPPCDNLHSHKAPQVSSHTCMQLERELVKLRKQLHEARASKSLATSRQLQDAGFDNDFDKLSSSMVRLEHERQRLLRMAFAHEVVRTTALSGKPIELIQEDAVRLIEKQQQSLRHQIQCVKEAITLSRDNQEIDTEDAVVEDRIRRVEVQLQQYASSASSRSWASSVSAASFGGTEPPLPHLSVLTRCRSVPAHLFHETWHDLDEDQKHQLHHELRANKSFHIRRDRVCVGNAPANSRPDGEPAPSISRQSIPAFTRYPPNAADKLGVQALFLEQSQRSPLEICRVYEAALTAEPNHAIVLGNYARFLSTKGRDPSRAEQLFDDAMRADPLCGVNVASYATFMHYTREKYDHAERLYVQALQLLPTDPQLLGNYARLLRKQANGSVSQLLQAKELLTKALAIENGSLPNCLCLCAVLEDLGESAQALREYEQLVQAIKPPTFSNSRGEEDQTLTPRTAGAIAQCAHVFGNFANFLTRSRDFERAKKLYETALRLQPEDPILQRNLICTTSSLLLRAYKQSTRV